jgi:hypothetical protein
MKVVTSARHRVGIAGHVKDAFSGRLLGGAKLVISDMPQAFRQRLRRLELQWVPVKQRVNVSADTFFARDDGLFYLLDLPPGDYKLSASHPASGKRFGMAEVSVSVVYDGEGNFKPSWVEILLPPTGLQGTIACGKIAMANVSVCVRGSAESAYSDTLGRYVLTGIEPGPRTVLIKGQGLQPALQAVDLIPGQILTKDFKVLREHA